MEIILLLKDPVTILFFLLIVTTGGYYNKDLFSNCKSIYYAVTKIEASQLKT